jgi:hypothetical protein
MSKDGLRVIGAGMGRTGTTSLKYALERLGFAPCHHMKEVVEHPEEVPTWQAAARGEEVDWVRFLSGWGAAVDFPSALYYRELMQAFPDAKVILSVRDPDSWYESMRQTIVPALMRFPNRLILPLLPRIGGPHRVMSNTHLHRDLLARFDDREHAKKVFVDWNEEVKRTVPSERLLVFEPKDGWQPLCDFLGVSVPDEPFPRLNDTAEFRRFVRAGTAMSWAVLLLPIVLAVVLAVRMLAPGW